MSLVGAQHTPAASKEHLWTACQIRRPEEAPHARCSRCRVLRQFEFVPYGETLDDQAERLEYHHAMRAWQLVHVTAAIEATWPVLADAPRHIQEVGPPLQERVDLQHALAACMTECSTHCSAVFAAGSACQCCRHEQGSPRDMPGIDVGRALSIMQGTQGNGAWGSCFQCRRLRQAAFRRSPPRCAGTGRLAAADLCHLGVCLRRS